MLELPSVVQDFAGAIQRPDSRGPQAVGARTGRSYQPGIGPHTESQIIDLVINELVDFDAAYAAYGLDVPYPRCAAPRCARAAASGPW
jgi:hypothetical protein